MKNIFKPRFGKSLKILIVNSFYYPNELGGAEKSVRFLAESLVKKGNLVRVVCLGKRESIEQFNGVEIQSVNIRNIYLQEAHDAPPPAWKKVIWHGVDAYNLLSRFVFDSILKDFLPDLVHTNTLSGLSVSIWGAARARGIPVVHTVRDFYLLCSKSTMLKNGHSCSRQCASCAFFCYPKIRATVHVDHLVGISEFMCRKHRQFGLFEGVPQSVIYNPYDAHAVNQRKIESVKHIGFIGRLDPAKGVELLIDAFRMLHDRNAGLKLLIAGDGRAAYIERLKQLADGLPVSFLGKVEPADFFAKIDMAVVPSIWEEPLGRVVIEALAYGRPVVATPVGGIPELLSVDTGVVAESATVDALVRALDELLRKLDGNYELWSTAALQSAARFRSSTIADTYLSVFEGAVDGHRHKH